MRGIISRSPKTLHIARATRTLAGPASIGLEQEIRKPPPGQAP